MTTSAENTEALDFEIELVRKALQSAQEFAHSIELTEIEDFMGTALVALKRIERRLKVTPA